MSEFRLPNASHIAAAHLRVQNLARALNFYRDVLGFTVIDESETTVGLMLAPDEAPILRLTEHPDAIRKPQRSTGLYHVAILTPSRQALGRVLQRLLTVRYPLQGASDHLVSEALYLADPDGNGLEIYRDRPRDEWRMDGDQVAMATEPMDAEGVLDAADDAPWHSIASGTVIGHVHLHVSDLKQAEAFYSDLLGFTVMQRSYPGALFVAAGGYHHHLGLNTWAGRTPPPANAVGLENFSVAVPGDAWETVVAHTQAQPIDAATASVSDPDQNVVLLVKA